jgi:hypothetical protein
MQSIVHVAFPAYSGRAFAKRLHKVYHKRRTKADLN